jgi:diaminohydroxyphosphoribosylaminopyrimidine deaminase/5-amino-6-(5-phosphoribosylamino)uracil reductase
LSVTLKLATSLDGRIATASGESRWITGEEARRAVHRLRAEHDAVVVGIETALADDPELTVRLPGYEGRQPARVVLDTRQRLPPSSRLAQTAGAVPTYLVTLGELSPELSRAGVRFIPYSAVSAGEPDLPFALGMLGAEGITDFLFEGGGKVAASLLRLKLVDRIEWFRAPIVLGEEGRPCIGGLGLEALAEAPEFHRVAVEALGADLWERYERP